MTDASRHRRRAGWLIAGLAILTSCREREPVGEIRFEEIDVSDATYIGHRLERPVSVASLLAVYLTSRSPDFRRDLVERFRSECGEVPVDLEGRFTLDCMLVGGTVFHCRGMTSPEPRCNTVVDPRGPGAELHRVP